MKWDFFFKSIWLIGGRYFMIAGIAFLIWYVLLRKQLLFKKIQSRFPRTKDYLREIFFSALTIAIFSFVSVQLFTNPAIAPYTTKYNLIAEYGWVYYFLLFP